MDLRLKFDEDVVNYENMRPTYVQELFQDVIRFSSLNPLAEALEIGIGTGQATLPFLKTGCQVTAIELGESMARYSAAKFSDFPNFQVINQDFEGVPLEPGRYDLIYSATAFHWIPQDIGYPKAYQLLKSGGTLALFWNRPFPAREDDLHAAIQNVYERYSPKLHKPGSTHKHNEDNCKNLVRTIEQYGYRDASYKLYHTARTFDANRYISLLNTYSDHRALPDEQRVLLEQGLEEAIRQHGGQIRVQDTIELYLARKP
ncbi:class I SAM-dependent methyltransferase [Gorillibacterium sp. sgz5001074]|uniref:class I SAM-dependent methyltransferase n=1 Tax=Gorillibacterium sp. sgz5001074 TaxID=3446695 RepID=UPI003F676FE6